MFDKLDDLLKRYEEIQLELADPMVTGDQSRFRKLMKEQMDGLMPEVKDFEPEMALYGGEDGLDFYRILTTEGAKHLKKGENGEGGRLIVEIGFDQGISVPELFRRAGFSDVRVWKDYAGNDRVVSGHL